MIKSYKDSEGNIRWKPDAVVGSEKYYGIKLTDFLAKENDTLTGATWDVPTGLTNLDERIKTSDQPEIKLRADTAGSYKITLTVDTVELTDTQKPKWEIYLEVV